MAKSTSKKKLKFKKIKDHYQKIIEALSDQNKKLNEKIIEMEEYFLEKITYYHKKYDIKIKEIEEDNLNMNMKYLDILKKLA